MKPDSGFTLIEILVALAILALALSAAMATVHGTVMFGATLEDRVLAGWIAENHISEFRLGIDTPDVGESGDTVEFAGRDWRWTARVSETPAEGLMRIDVDVAYADDPDRVLITLSGFMGSPYTRTSALDWKTGASSQRNEQRRQR